MTVAVYAVSVVLAVTSMWLFVLAARRLLGRQEEIVTAMLSRYDDRLAEFAQTLNDALAAAPSPALAPAAALPEEALEPGDHGVVMRTLELAVDKTDAHAALAIVAGSTSPTLATVGLTQAEAAHVGRMGVPDYRGARAIQVSFSGETEAPAGKDPIRSGLVVPLLASDNEPGMLAVLTRSEDRRFSEADISTLEEVVTRARPALDSSLELTAPDPVPALDPLTELYDRRAFHALLEREIDRARLAGLPLALLMLDVDRLTTLNARIGHLAADDVLAQVAAILRHVADREHLPCRIGGGRFSVLLPHGDVHDAEQLFQGFRAALEERPIPNAGVVSVSGGAADLVDTDDAADMLGRADAALALAKGSGRGMVVTTSTR
jgi:diguanylate cyclase (GGDEF)-like protein